MKIEAAHSMFIMGFLKDTSFILKSAFIGNTQMKLQYINITLKKYAERELVLSLTVQNGKKYVAVPSSWFVFPSYSSQASIQDSHLRSLTKS